MKRHLLTLGTAALLGQGLAANYSQTIWDYVRGTATAPDTQNTNPQGDITRTWLRPGNVPTEVLMVVYSPKVSTNAWAVMLTNTSARPADFFGTNQWKPYTKPLLPTAPGARPLMTYQLTAGLFKGLIFGERVLPSGKHVVFLWTPEGAARMIQHTQEQK